MGVAARVKEAIDKMNLGDPDNALVQICLALDATAKKEYPKNKVGERIKEFLRDNQVFLTSFVNLEVGGDILMEFQGKSGEPETRRLEEVLYKLVRCALVHEAELSDRVIVTSELKFGLSKDSKFILSLGLIWGMIIAVIGSPANLQERVPDSYGISVRGEKFILNELWGKKVEILRLVRKRKA